MFPLSGKFSKPFAKELFSCSLTQWICKNCKQSGTHPKGEIEAKWPHKAILHLGHASEAVVQWCSKSSSSALPTWPNTSQLDLCCKCWHWVHTGSKNVDGLSSTPSFMLRLAVVLQSAKGQCKDKGGIKTSHKRNKLECSPLAWIRSVLPVCVLTCTNLGLIYRFSDGRHILKSLLWQWLGQRTIIVEWIIKDTCLRDLLFRVWSSDCLFIESGRN